MLVAFFPSLASPGAWEPLFDGSDVSQWRGMTGDPFPTDCWQVEDGLLKTVPGWKQRDLITTGQFEDFELEWEWRLSAGGNAGMKILVEDGRMHPDFVRPRRRAVLPMAAGFLVLLYAVWRRRRWLALAAGLLSIGGALGVAFFTRIGTWQAVGPEYQMLDDARHPDGRNGPAFQTGALYALLPPEKRAARPVGEWNQSRIVKQGRRVEYWLNGECVLAYSLDDPGLARRVAASKFRNTPGFLTTRRGHISLQHHQDEAWFRAIRVRPAP